MPVLTRRSSDQGRSDECGPEMNAWEQSSACESLLEIASSILLARSCDQNVESYDMKGSRACSAGDCEIFLPMNNETLEVMRRHMETLHQQGVPLCIEVKGQGESAGLLLEQWTLQTSSKRSAGPVIPLTFLTQAVSSYLHFSQLRSWIVAGEGGLPFEVLYRVCAPGEDGELFWSPPDVHTFPSAPLPSHHSLDITVKSLPRHTHIPPILHPPTPSHTHDSVVSDKSVRTTPLRKEDVIAAGTTCANGTCAIVSSTSTNAKSPCAPLSISANGTCALVSSTSVSMSASSLRAPTSGSASDTSGSASGTSVSTSSSEVNMRTSRNGSTSHPLAKTVDREEDAPSLASANYQPLASSPVPWKRGVRGKRRSCALNVKYITRPRPPVRSNSCPAVVPSLCLLGTFEESVLNGRMKPCGYVEGFTAELGASGSFRPAHVSLPVEAAYFSVHPEHEGRGSPYLGHIDLTGVGKKGYRVPKKGTFQLTLFNPNKTVVKIYILTYDLSDMPSLTQTFVRQKTLSEKPSGGIPHLHYLMHLRFHSSKTGHVYLTKNIKLIFARRAPDTMDFDPSQVNLYTVSEGPTQPKYCPL